MAIWQTGERITAARLNNQEVTSLKVGAGGITSEGGGRIRHAHGSYAVDIFAASGFGTYVGSFSNHPLIFRTNDVDRMMLGTDASLYVQFPVANKWKIHEITLTNDQQVSVASVMGGTNGTLWITSNTNGNVYGCVAVRGGNNSVSEIYDAIGTIATTDTGGNLCIVSVGSGSYLIINRLGSTQSFALMFMGS